VEQFSTIQDRRGQRYGHGRTIVVIVWRAGGGWMTAGSAGSVYGGQANSSFEARISREKKNSLSVRIHF
jgi:hypothetical protein